jgi:hypothetical protein
LGGAGMDRLCDPLLFDTELKSALCQAVSQNRVVSSVKRRAELAGAAATGWSRPHHQDSRALAGCRAPGWLSPNSRRQRWNPPPSRLSLRLVIPVTDRGATSWHKGRNGSGGSSCVSFSSCSQSFSL